MASDLDRLLVEAMRHRGSPINPTKKDLADMLRGGAVALPAGVMDLLGMAGNAVSPYPLNFSGDPLREKVGLDPKSKSGTMGEILLDPSAGVGKGVKMAGALAKHLPDIGVGLAQALLHASKDPRAGVKGITNNIRDLFDTKFIGDASKGEGHIARGWGLYFAEGSGTNKNYISKFTNKKIEGSKEIADALDRANGDKALAYKWLMHHADTKPNPDEAQKLRRYAEKIRQGYDPRATNFEVEIPDKVINEMLDLDVLSDKDIKKLEKTDWWRYAEDEIEERSLRSGRNPSGDDVVRWLQEDYTPEEAAKVLYDAGFPGSKFYDGSSRRRMEGTRNFILFSPDDITQVKRDGELVYENTDLAKALRDGK